MRGSSAGEIAKLAQQGIVSANATAKALNERGVKTARGGRWEARSVIAIRQRLLDMRRAA